MQQQRLGYSDSRSKKETEDRDFAHIKTSRGKGLSFSASVGIATVPLYRRP